MKVTTVRFGSDLWALLESEAERVGVSVAQYLREAALARAAAAAAARGEAPFELLARGIREPPADHPDAKLRREALAALARLAAAEARAGAQALAAESRQARRTAKSRREQAGEVARDARRALGDPDR